MRKFLPSMQALLAFEAVARCASVTRAAADLSLTQSAVSHQLRMLEELGGVELFRRLPRRVELTDAGHALLRRVGPALDGIEAGMLDLVSSKGLGGVLELAVVPTFATKWLIPRLPDFFAAHPLVTVNLSTQLVPFEFEATRFDAAVHYGRPDWPGTRSEYLMGEESVVVCSAALANSGRLTSPADVLGFPLIHQSSRPYAWGDWLRAAGVVVDDKATRGPKYELFTMIAPAVAAGLGLAVLPRFLVADEIRAGVLAVPFDLPLLSNFAYYLVWPDPKATWLPMRMFREWLRRQASSTAGDGPPGQ
jgi:LysR family transcriptional regulator, glycine cleavage system transcriptional activator